MLLVVEATWWKEFVVLLEFLHQKKRIQYPEVSALSTSMLFCVRNNIEIVAAFFGNNNVYNKTKCIQEASDSP